MTCSTEMVRKSVGAGLPGGNPAQGLTPRAKHVVEIAMEDSIRGGYAYIGTEHLLAGILREGNNMAVRILRYRRCGRPSALYRADAEAHRRRPEQPRAATAVLRLPVPPGRTARTARRWQEFTRDLTADARDRQAGPGHRP